MARTPPSGARGRMWSKFTFNVRTSNYIPNESSWHDRTEKIGCDDIWNYQISKITFFHNLSLINYQGAIQSILSLFQPTIFSQLSGFSQKLRVFDYKTYFTNFSSSYYFWIWELMRIIVLRIHLFSIAIADWLFSRNTSHKTSYFHNQT